MQTKLFLATLDFLAREMEAKTGELRLATTALRRETFQRQLDNLRNRLQIELDYFADVTSGRPKRD